MKLLKVIAKVKSPRPSCICSIKRHTYFVQHQFLHMNLNRNTLRKNVFNFQLQPFVFLIFMFYAYTPSHQLQNLNPNQGFFFYRKKSGFEGKKDSLNRIRNWPDSGCFLVGSTFFFPPKTGVSPILNYLIFYICIVKAKK